MEPGSPVDSEGSTELFWLPGTSQTPLGGTGHHPEGEVSVRGAGQASLEGAQAGGSHGSASRTGDAQSVAAAHSAASSALPSDQGAFSLQAFWEQINEIDQLLGRRSQHVSAAPRLHMGSIAPPDAAAPTRLPDDVEGFGVPGPSAAGSAPRPPNRYIAPAAAGGSMFRPEEDNAYDQAADSGRSLQSVKDGQNDLAAKIAGEFKTWSAKASAQSKLAVDPAAQRDLAATADCLARLARLTPHALLSYLPLTSYVIGGVGSRMKVIAGSNFEKDAASVEGARLACFLACNLPKWERALIVASSDLEANLELGDLVVEGCFRRFNRMARWLAEAGVEVPTHLPGAARVAEGEPYRTPELSQQSVALVQQPFDSTMATTKDGHARAACQRVHGYLTELGGRDWESCFWRLCADDLTRDWRMKIEHLAVALGAPNLADLDRTLHNISCCLSCEAVAAPPTVVMFQQEWSASTSLTRTAARFSAGVQRAAQRAALFKQVLATAATRTLPITAAQEVQRAAGEVDAILQVLAYMANVTGFSGVCGPSLAAAGMAGLSVART